MYRLNLLGVNTFIRAILKRCAEINMRRERVGEKKELK